MDSPGLFPRNRGDESTAPQELVFSAIFVDTPNIQNHGYEYGVTARPHLIEWRTLTKRLQLDTRGTQRVFSGAYVRLLDSKERNIAASWLTRALQQWTNDGFSFIPQDNKDIDWVLIGDIWRTVVKLFLDHRRVRLRIILVSGDGDYARTFFALRELFGENLELELIVYSWAESLSGELRACTDEGNIRLLNDIPELVKERE